MPQLAVNGTQLHYQILGEGNPVVMIHGLLVGNMTSWYFGAAASLAKKHEVMLYDLRGHGMSEKAQAGYTLESMVSDLEALVQEKKIKNISLVGHSYGGLIALHFAIRHPQLVKKLVIVEAPLPAGRALEMSSFFLKSPDEMLKSLPTHLQEVVGAPNRQAKKFIERIQFLAFETSLLDNLKKETDIPDEILQDIQVPTLLIYGKTGQLTDVGMRLKKLIPHSQLSLIAGGHYLPSENSAELTQKMEDFIV